MTTLSPFLIVIPLAVLASCIGIVVLVVRDFARSNEKPPAWRQIVMLLIATFFFMNLGVLWVSGESGMPIIVAGALPSVFFLAVGSAWPRLLSVLLLCGFVVLGCLDHHAEKLRGERIRAHYEQKVKDAAAQQIRLDDRKP
jgi:chromate transport protein ChrA